jgi:hypothetical protein
MREAFNIELAMAYAANMDTIDQEQCMLEAACRETWLREELHKEALLTNDPLTRSTTTITAMTLLTCQTTAKEATVKQRKLLTSFDKATRRGCAAVHAHREKCSGR